MTTGWAGFLGWCFGWLTCVLTIVAVGGHERFEKPSVKCPQVETSTYRYAPPKDKRVPLPPGPMEPSKWG